MSPTLDLLEPSGLGIMDPGPRGPEPICWYRPAILKMRPKFNVFLCCTHPMTLLRGHWDFFK